MHTGTLRDFRYDERGHPPRCKKLKGCGEDTCRNARASSPWSLTAGCSGIHRRLIGFIHKSNNTCDSWWAAIHSPHKRIMSCFMWWTWILHVAAAGLWLGCVLTEVAFERALQGPGRDARLRLSALHRNVDLFIELPAMGIVLITGLALWTRSGGVSPAWFHVKLALVAAAWIANAWCVVVVLRRHDAARIGDMTMFEEQDRLQHRLGAVVLAGLGGGLIVAMLT